MVLGLIALLLAAAAAGWLLLRLAQGESIGGEDRNMTILKIVIWLGIVGALFAAKLLPLAFMVLFAAGGVMAIETWKNKRIETDGDIVNPSAPASRSMTTTEAAAVLGVPQDASAEDIRAAHKKLIAQIHPDKGGTDYLASKINEARDLLTGRLGEGE